MTKFVSDGNKQTYDESERVTFYTSVRGTSGAGKDATLSLSATELRANPLAPVTLAALALFMRTCAEAARDGGAFGSVAP